MCMNIYKKEVGQNHRVLHVSEMRLRAGFWDMISSALFVRGKHKIAFINSGSVFLYNFTVYEIFYMKIPCSPIKTKHNLFFFFLIEEIRRYGRLVYL